MIHLRALLCFILWQWGSKPLIALELAIDPLKAVWGDLDLFVRHPLSLYPSLTGLLQIVESTFPSDIGGYNQEELRVSESLIIELPKVPYLFFGCGLFLQKDTSYYQKPANYNTTLDTSGFDQWRVTRTGIYGHALIGAKFRPLEEFGFDAIVTSFHVTTFDDLWVTEQVAIIKKMSYSFATEGVSHKEPAWAQNPRIGLHAGIEF